jgi:hypothetical protein
MKTQNIKKAAPGHNNSCPARPNDSAIAPDPLTPLSPSSPSVRPVPSIPLSPPAPQTENFPRAEENPVNEKLATPERNDQSLSSSELQFRAGSFLGQLTYDQRTQLFKWLLEYSVPDVLRLVAAAPPNGFGIQTHKTTLRRIKGIIRSHEANVSYENSSASAELLTETIRDNRPQFAPLISELLLQKAFDAASDTRQTHELKDLISSAIKLRELDLKVQRLQLLRERTPRRTRVQIKTSPSLPDAKPNKTTSPQLSPDETKPSQSTPDASQ